MKCSLSLTTRLTCVRGCYDGVRVDHDDVLHELEGDLRLPLEDLRQHVDQQLVRFFVLRVFHLHLHYRDRDLRGFGDLPAEQVQLEGELGVLRVVAVVALQVSQQLVEHRVALRVLHADDRVVQRVVACDQVALEAVGELARRTRST